MTTTLVAPGTNLPGAAATLGPGDELVLRDGTYPVTSGSHGLQIRHIHGTPNNPILIRAANDGQAIMDGLAGANGNFEPFYLTDCTNVIIDGIRFKNSYASVAKIDASAGVGNGPCDNILMRRCSATGAGSGNHHIFDTNGDGTHEPTNITFEDCFGYGPGRYMFLAYHAQNVTFRRCFGYWNTVGFVNSILQPRSPYGDYGSQNTLLENCIGTHSYPSSTDHVITNNYFTALYQTSDDQTNFPVTNTRVLGSIFLGNWEGYWLNSDASGGGTLIKDCYFECPKDTLAADQFTTTNQGDGFHIAGNAASHQMRNCTFVGSNKGWSSSGTIGQFSIKNSSFYKNTQAIETDPGHNNCNFFGNGSGTAITLYAVAQASSTLSGATRLVLLTGGTEASNANTTDGSVTTGYLEARSKNGTLQVVSASLPAPSGHGWLYDTTALEGLTLPDFPWSGSATYSTSGMANAAFDGVRRWSIYHKNGTYTTIGTITISDTFGASGVHTVYAWPDTQLVSPSFANGDKLYVDEFLNATWGAVSGVGFSLWQCSGSTAGLADHAESNVPGPPVPTLSPGDMTVDPNYPTQYYGRGAYFFVAPGSSPLYQQGDDGSNIGCEIIYRYVNGSLTNTLLWPWPMESRIQAELGISVNGLFWNTLDGIPWTLSDNALGIVRRGGNEVSQGNPLGNPQGKLVRMTPSNLPRWLRRAINDLR